MKKLMFLVHFSSLKKSSGIIEKIITQSKNMYNVGILYKTVIMYKSEEKNDVNNFEKCDFIEFVPLEEYKNTRNKFKKVLMLNKVFDKYIEIADKEKKNYDYLYIRYNPLYLGFMKFAKKFKNKIIFEHNSMEAKEYKSNKSLYNIVMSALFDKKVKNYAAGYVCVSSDVMEFENKQYKNQKNILITNGIDTNKFKLRKIPKFDGKNLDLIFVGNIRYWHGLERMFYAMENYKGDMNITFNVFGEINQKDYLTPIVNNLSIKDKIVFHGYKTPKELEKEFDINHIAVGCLGCYKKNMFCASVLKNREYFARGVPIVFSEIDEDISNDENNGLFLQVPNDDTPIDMEQIVEFAIDFYKNSEKNTEKIRKFAEEKLDYSKKVLKLREMLNEME